jgi:hypothetical protein
MPRSKTSSWKVKAYDRQYNQARYKEQKDEIRKLLGWVCARCGVFGAPHIRLKKGLTLEVPWAGIYLRSMKSLKKLLVPKAELLCNDCHLKETPLVDLEDTPLE